MEQADQRAAGHRLDRRPAVRRELVLLGTRQHGRIARHLKKPRFHGGRASIPACRGFRASKPTATGKAGRVIDVMRQYGEIPRSDRVRRRVAG